MEMKTRAIALACVIAVAAPFVPAVGLADNQFEAKVHYEKGLQLYDDGAYDAALVELERAYELNPSWKLFYNIGLIHQQLADFAAALKAFNRYLSEGGKDVPKERRDEVEKLVVTLKTRVAKLTITAPAGSELTIDDAPVGKAPLSEAVVVNAGHHKVSATLEGRSTTKLVTVATSEQASVDLKIDAEAVVPPPPPPPPPHGEEKSSHFPVVPWVITGVIAGGAVVTGIVALGASSKLSDARTTDGVTRSTLDDDRSKTKTFALVTDILAGAAIVGAGVSLYLTLSSSSSSTKDTGATSTKLGVAPNGLVVFGSF